MLQVGTFQIPPPTLVNLQLFCLLQPEDLGTVVCPQGVVMAQAAVSAGDRLLMGLAGIILSHLVHVSMQADENSL